MRDDRKTIFPRDIKTLPFGSRRYRNGIAKRRAHTSHFPIKETVPGTPESIWGNHRKKSRRRVIKVYREGHHGR